MPALTSVPTATPMTAAKTAVKATSATESAYASAKSAYTSVESTIPPVIRPSAIATIREPVIIVVIRITGLFRASTCDLSYCLYSFQPSSAFFPISISVRDDIKLADEHAKAAIIDLPQTGGLALRLGVIDLPSFYGMAGQRADGASSDTTRLIKKLKQEGVRGLILDLRRNGGGSLEEAVRLTGLFIPSGPVVQTWMPEDDWRLARRRKSARSTTDHWWC